MHHVVRVTPLRLVELWMGGEQEKGLLKEGQHVGDIRFQYEMAFAGTNRRRETL